MQNWIFALIPFALMSFFAVLFTRKRWAAKITYSVWAVVIAAVSITHIVFFSLDKGNMLLLSLMPLTAYMPVIVAFFVLSNRNVVSNILAMLISLLCSASVTLTSELVSSLWVNAHGADNWGAMYTALNVIVSLATSAVLGFVCYHYLSKIFENVQVLDNKTWYALPAVLLLLLFSLYQLELLRQPLIIGFLLIMNVSVLSVIIALIVSKYKNAETEAERAAVAEQLAAEREQYDSLKVAVEADKRYRHDIKHHFAAIAALAADGDNEDISEYVETLGATLAEGERHSFCNNSVMNAVLSSFFGRAKESGVQTEIDAVIPELLPVEESDLCAFLSNAFDNALNACNKIKDGDKRITLSVKCDGTKTAIKIVNTVERDVPLSKDGLPVYERTENHGWGLSSMQCVAEKYGGFLSCSSENATFTLAAVLFSSPLTPPEARKSKKRTTLQAIAAVPIVLFTAILSINCMPSMVNALESIPSFGKAIEIIDFRTWGWDWGDSGIEIDEPITNDKDANEIIAGYVKECRERFEWYYARKYHGYVYSEFKSTELINDEEKYVVEMSCIIYAGSSAEYMRYFVVDKRTDEIVTLEDLFASGSDWNATVSNEIRRQMQETVDSDEGDYFGFGDWANQDGFTCLDDPSFYIDVNGQLVIVFDEHEVAPGNMGSPRFTVSRSVVNGILSENSLLKADV